MNPDGTKSLADPMLLTVIKIRKKKHKIDLSDDTRIFYVVRNTFLKWVSLSRGGAVIQNGIYWGQFRKLISMPVP